MTEPDRIIRSAESEKGILGCILLDPVECMPICEERLDSKEAFYELVHQEIYEAILELHSANTPISITSIQVRLEEKKTLEGVGGLTYLAGLEDATPSAANLPYFIDVVNSRYRARLLVKMCGEAIEQVYESADSIEQHLEEFEARILSIRQNMKTKTVDLRSMVQSVLQNIEAVHNDPKSVRCIMTGFADLDRMCGGFKAGEMTVIAGFPGSGKTSLAMNIAENGLLRHGKTVAVFSYEMSAESLITRFIASHAQVDISAINRGYLTPEDFPKVIKSGSTISSSKLWIDEGDNATMASMRARARRLHQKHSLDLIIIDYLQLLSSPKHGRDQSRQEEVSDVSRSIKLMAKELGIPVIALSQVNDDGKLRESRSIGQDADNVWILETKGTLEDKFPVVEVKIVKARNGPVGRCELLFRKKITRFENILKAEEG